MIIATPDGKYYSETWHEKDNFKQRRLKEITKEYAHHLCTESQDYVIFKTLSVKDRLSMMVGSIQ